MSRHSASPARMSPLDTLELFVARADELSRMRIIRTQARERVVGLNGREPSNDLPIGAARRRGPPFVSFDVSEIRQSE